MQRVKDRARPQFVLALACLFLSGMAGLIYEIVWSRYLALFLGHASYAIIAVLVAFMGGLALGNLAFGAWADRTTRPLTAYGWVEIGIGLFAVLFPAYNDLCYDGFIGLARHLGPGSPGVLALKFLFSIAAILVPTMLMGGTLPLLARLLTRSLGDMHAKVAALYFINSAGGVLGIWVADFWLIEAVGLAPTLFASALLNFAVGGAAIFLSRRLGEGAADDDATEPAAAPAPAPTPSPDAAEAEELPASAVRLAVWGIGVSGFVAMLYQIAWTRLLALALGSSTHAFALMLMTFIVGLAVGSAVVSAWRGLRRTLVAFGWAELALGVSVGLSLYFYEFLPYWFFRLASLLTRRPEAYPVYQWLQALICFLVMLIPTVCLGMTLPLVTRATTSSLARTGRSVGRIFAVNTAGTVLGAAVTGLALLPLLGLARTFILGVVVNCGLGLAVLGRDGLGPRRRLVTTAVGVLLAGLIASSGWLAQVWRGALTFGAWRQREFASSAREFHQLARTSPIAYYRDGADATVSVHAGTNLNGLVFLKVNGKSDAGTGSDMATQLLLGHVPMLLRSNTSEVLVIGLGSGVTAGAVAAHPSLTRVDVVEISPEVREAARFFDAHNRQVMRDPRFHLTLEDAKSFLLLTPRRYHAIISEPSNPWMAGVAGVFSLEFYESCRDHLAPDGLMVQWVQLYEFSDAALDMVLATFKQVFPNFSLWHTEGSDILLVGSPQPLPRDLDGFARRLREPAVTADLERVRLGNLPLLLSHELVSPLNAPFLPAPTAALHSDYQPVLEYTAQRDFFVRKGASRFRQVDENFSRRPTTLLGDYLQRQPLTEADFQAFARSYVEEQKTAVDLFASLLLHWQLVAPNAFEPLELASRFRFLNAPGELDALRLGPRRDALLARARENPTLLRQYGLGLMRAYTEQRSCFHAPPTTELTAMLERLIELDPNHQRVYQAYLAELAWDRGDDDRCLEFGRRAILGDMPRGSARFKLDTFAPLRTVALVADVLQRRGQDEAAAALCDQAARGYLTDAVRENALFFEVAQRRAEAGFARAAAAPRP